MTLSQIKTSCTDLTTAFGAGDATAADLNTDATFKSNLLDLHQAVGTLLAGAGLAPYPQKGTKA